MRTCIDCGYDCLTDTSIVWEYTYDDHGQLVKAEIVSFYSGKPLLEKTELYSEKKNRGVTAYYD